MAYQVLARKWRSQTFDTLIGQEHVTTTLTNALKNNRVPHALLFTGARGVGKTSAARILAKSLRCPNLKDHTPCGKCTDCVEIAEGRSINVIEIDGASNNGVENVRELRESVGYMPSTGKFKVYIIDEVHMLSNSAFNALLKTLEEPPEHVIFIFATTEVQKIPVTILSRCQRYDFRRISIKKVADHIASICAQEGVSAEMQALWLVARESEGSMRDSLSLLDQVISFCGKKITHNQVIDVLGLTDRTLLSTTLKAIITADVNEAMNVAEKVFKFGYDPKQFAQDLLEHIRSLMVVKVSGNKRPEFLDLPENEIEELTKIANELSHEDIHFLFDMSLKGVSDIMRAQDPSIVLEMLLLRLTQAPRLSSIESVVEALESGKPLEKKTSILDKPIATPLQQENQIQNQNTFIESIKKEKPLLGAKLEYATLELATDASNLTVFFRKEQEFFFTQVSQKEVVAQLVDLAEKYWGKKIAIQVKLGQSINQGPLSLQESQAAAKKEAQREAVEKIEAHPLVKDAKNILKAKITSIKTSKETRE
ncbi:MAG: DNA polymerase III subunit gamma/tau [Oligoflexia bacterium]|nr:DNA polymerase III subunit gamma/tau [Oligoflexia bacterium]